MIETLSDMPDGVTGIRVSGRVSGEDLKEYQPTFDALLKSGDDIRIVEVIDSDYQGFGPGGLVEDLKLGLGSLFTRHSAFKRVAVVSDKEWVVHTIHLVGWLMPGEVAVFGLDELDQAKQWAAG
ncbi:STAS/SEC14 domain-containing protein [Mycobacterium sp. shizuoka-1]|uniref:STAS/SEC14 domain-containing protein n=1 Tax=Mycobacterium sp. shizuoka-1 TaxID=2039281 RepID=UPI000C065162|nr:STAS/SEC14 domain-containing protein [Mycobacterium sp. shizuoka-1]GAY18193.1 hypothetical protein MSZK_49190 [Mycobacterium sp. shizuoka-1]